MSAPYLLVGHSLAGWHLRLFAQQHRKVEAFFQLTVQPTYWETLLAEWVAEEGNRCQERATPAATHPA